MSDRTILVLDTRGMVRPLPSAGDADRQVNFSCCFVACSGASIMRPVFGIPGPVATELQGQFRPGEDKIVTRKFGLVAKVLWPEKTAAHVAAIADADERTAKRWLAGEFEPPAIVIAAIIVEITKRR